MNQPTCTTLSEAETCASVLAACPDADGRVIGFAIQVAIAAIKSNHGCAFVETLIYLNDHYSLCGGTREHAHDSEGH